MNVSYRFEKKRVLVVEQTYPSTTKSRSWNAFAGHAPTVPGSRQFCMVVSNSTSIKLAECLLNASVPELYKPKIVPTMVLQDS